MKNEGILGAHTVLDTLNKIMTGYILCGYKFKKLRNLNYLNVCFVERDVYSVFRHWF